MVPAGSVRATLLLVLGPDRIFTPEVTRAWLDDEDELPELDDPEELLELEEPPELDELDDPPEPDDDPEERALMKSCQTHPVLPLTRT